MHYYKRKIGDYRRRTNGLSLLEHGAYNQLIDEYYLDEAALPLDGKKLSKKIGARTDEEKEAMNEVLELFFEKTEQGWFHSHCDEIVQAYQANAIANGINGKKGGRPKKENPKETHSVNSEKPNESQNNPNNEQITINKKQDTSKKFSDDDYTLSNFIFKRLLKLNPNHKKPNLEKWADEIRVMREQDNRTLKDLQDVFIWANEDEFWSTNILSPAALRKQFDKLVININKPVKTSLLKLPDNDAKLLQWATKEHNFPNSGQMDYFEYKKVIRGMILRFGILENGEISKPEPWMIMPEINADLELWVRKWKFPACPSEYTSYADYREKVLQPAIDSRFRRNWEMPK